MNKEDIIKFIDGIPFYRYDYTDFLYQKLEEKDKENERLNNIINELGEWLEGGIEETNWLQGDMYWSEACEKFLDKLQQLKENKQCK